MNDNNSDPIACSECEHGIYTRAPKELKLPSPHGPVVVSINVLRCEACDDELIPNDQLNKISISLLSAKVREAQKNLDTSLTEVQKSLKELSEYINYK